MAAGSYFWAVFVRRGPSRMSCAATGCHGLLWALSCPSWALGLGLDVEISKQCEFFNWYTSIGSRTLAPHPGLTLMVPRPGDNFFFNAEQSFRRALFCAFRETVTAQPCYGRLIFIIFINYWFNYWGQLNWGQLKSKYTPQFINLILFFCWFDWIEIWK